MSITYPLNAPATPYPRSINPALLFVTSANQSPFTKQEQVYKWQGEQWMIDVQLPPMTRAEAAQWIAFAMELRGRYGTFLYEVQDGYVPMGKNLGTPLVKGAGQTGFNLLIDGLTNSITGQYLKGDYFSIGSGADTTLHMVTQDASSNGSGETTLQFQPSLKEAPADNAPLTFIAPKGHWRMVTNTVGWSVDLGMEYGFNFQATEALG